MARNHKLHKYNIPILINYVDITEIAVSSRVSFCKKGFKVTALCVMLSKMSAYSKDFDLTKYMSFLIKKMMNC